MRASRSWSRTLNPVVFPILAILLAAPASAEKPAVPDRQIPPEVAEVLQLRCQPCHSDPPQRFAPMPIVTWEQLHSPAPYDTERLVFEVIALRVGNEAFPMPPKETPELEAITDAERELVLDWVGQGAPAHGREQ